jgi:hypothetical protein
VSLPPKEPKMPQYTHDCDTCKYHGIVTFKGHIYDVYSCGSNPIDKSMIARFGNEGPEYSSIDIDTFDARKEYLQHSIFAVIREMI